MGMNMLKVKPNLKIIRFIAIFLLSFFVVLLAIERTSVSQSQPNNIKQFYISPSGNDNNSGTINQPFRTVQRAKRAVRTLNKPMTSNIVVNLRQGTYLVDNSLDDKLDNQQGNRFKFDELDKGGNKFQIIYQSFPKERATISGGRELSKWQLADRNRNIYKSYFGNSVYPRQFYVNGERAIRARGIEAPTGFKKTNSGFEFDNVSKPYSNITNWQNQADIEFVSLYKWTSARCHPSKISQKEINLQPNCFGSKGKSWNNGISWIENAYELLDEEGEWYFNRADGYVYYKPKNTEDINKVKAVVATQEKLLDIQSSNIQFKNLNFEYGTWFDPNTSDGYAVVHTGFHYKSVNGKSRAKAISSPGNIFIKRSNNIGFSGNLFQHLGAIAIDLRQGAQNINITGNKFEDISGASIQLGYNIDKNPQKVDEVQNITVKNNYIARVSQEFFDHAGINFLYAGNLNIEHNEISDVPYTGINLGNPALDPCTSTQAKNNKIQNNFIHNSMSKLVDGGAIYINSWQPNSLIDGNYISEVYHTASLYFDDGARGFTAQNNVMNPYNQDVQWTRSLSTTVFENNVQNNFYSRAKEYVDKSKGTFDSLRGVEIKCKVGLTASQSITNYTNNSRFESNAIPAKAKSIINKAGIEPSYEWVKDLNDKTHINLAFNQNVSSSSESDQFLGNKERAVDGSYTSKYGWSAAKSDRSPWYQVDLGSAQIINETQLAFHNQESKNISTIPDKPETRKNFEIRGSNTANFANPTLLFKQGNISVPYKSMLEQVFNNTQAFRYIRVVKTDNLPFTIFEFKLFSNSPQSLNINPLEIGQGICTQPDSSISGEVSQGNKVNCTFPIKSSSNQSLKAGYFEGNTKITSETCTVNSPNQLTCKNLPASNSPNFGTKSIFVESNSFTLYDRASIEVQPFIIGKGRCDRNSEFPLYANDKSAAYLGQRVTCKFPVRLGGNNITKLKAGYNTLYGFFASDCKFEPKRSVLICSAIKVGYNQLGQKYISIQSPKNYTWRNKAEITIKQIFNIGSGTCKSKSGDNVANLGEKVDCAFPLSGNPQGVPYILPIPNPDYPKNKISLLAQYKEGSTVKTSDPCMIKGTNLICENLPTNSSTGNKTIDVTHFGTTDWRSLNVLTIK